MPERRVKAGEFWLTTCGLDTNRRGTPRADTPWNSFTLDGKTLVNTIWEDRVVTVFDPRTKAYRRFVRLGMIFAHWTSQRRTRARRARNHIDDAFAKKLAFLGYEAAPNIPKRGHGDRSIKHFYLDRVHMLVPIRGPSEDAFSARLQLDEKFKVLIPEDEGVATMSPILFELQAVDEELPQTIFDPSNGSHAEDLASTSANPTVTSMTHEEMATRMLPILVEHVLSQRDGVMSTLTYGELAKRIGRYDRNGSPQGHGLGPALTLVVELIDGTSKHLLERPPYLTCIVVLSGGADQGLPDKGVRDRWPGYEVLTRKQKEDRVFIEFDRILAFGRRWNEVLALLGLPQVAGAIGGTGAGSRGWGWGGESEAHRLLKLYVLAHPESVGATAAFKGQVEFPLRSGDLIDVMFQSEGEWIGVEVKSRVSDACPQDYERGLYQVIKYKAVLEAQAQVDHPHHPLKVTVLLGLEGALPSQYRGQASALGVRWLEGVGAAELGAAGST